MNSIFSLQNPRKILWWVFRGGKKQVSCSYIGVIKEMHAEL